MLTLPDPSKMQLPRLDSGCWCCSLKICCNVQGYLTLVSIISAFVALLILINTGNYEDSCTRSQCRPYNSNGNNGISFYMERSAFKDWKRRASIERDAIKCEEPTLQQLCYRDFFIVMACVLPVYFFGTVMLLRGIYKKQPSLVMLYIRILYIHLTLSAVVLLWCFCNFDSRHYAIYAVVVNIVVVVYMLLCVNTLHLEMMEPSSQFPEMDTTPVIVSMPQPQHLTTTSPHLPTACSFPNAPPAYEDVASGPNMGGSGDARKTSFA